MIVPYGAAATDTLSDVLFNEVTLDERWIVTRNSKKTKYKFCNKRN